MLKRHAGILILCLAPLSVLAQAVRQLDVVVVLEAPVQAETAPGSSRAQQARSKRANNRALAARVASENGVAARHRYGTVLRGFSARINENKLAQLRRDSRVARIEYDGIAHANRGKPGSGGSEPESQVVPWGIERINADTASGTGSGIHVYVLDSGIDSDHADLVANLSDGWAGYSCKGKKCLRDWDDDNGHGTHVAGTIGAADNSIGVVGVAPEVTLHAVKVLHKSGSGAWSVIAAGVDWAASQVATREHPAVANMSLGGLGSKSGTCTQVGFTGSDFLHEAICNAKNLGLISVVSAGNSSADAQDEKPAAYDDTVITVSATTEGDDWIDWSNWGDDSAAWTGHNAAPITIAAPGVSIISTYNNGGTTTYSGTSMAAPHVAGAIAVYLQHTPQAAAWRAFDTVRTALLMGAEDTSGFSNTSGHPHPEGFLNMF